MSAMRLIRPVDQDLVMRGLWVLVGGPERSPGVPAAGNVAEIRDKVNTFLDYAGTISLDTRRQVLAMRRSCDTPDATERVAGMALWVPSPGRTAMLFCPGMSEHPGAAAETEAALAGAIEDARAAGVCLIQAMVEPSDAAGKTVFAAAGLSQLATLTYMERRPPHIAPTYALPDGITVATYERDTHALFRDAIARSYEGTLDCPALSGMREIDDVIAGHKAVGIFDPNLWTVLLRDGRPIGCLLLAEIPARHALELVYLGLAPEARGLGLGRVMMHRVLAIASRRHFEVATLAVDAANAPAMKLYRRSGYASVAQRVAMVRRLV